MRLLLVVPLLLTLSACTAPVSPRGGPEPGPPPGLELTLTAQGEGAAPGLPVVLTVVLRNASPAALDLGRGSSSCWARAYVLRAGHEEDISAFRVCTADLMPHRLEPGASHADRWEWEGQVLQNGTRVPLPPGTYRVIPAYGGWRGTPVEVRVAS